MRRRLPNRVDPRRLIFFGCFWLGVITCWRALANSDMDFWTICIPLFVMGVGMPMYYVPITGLAMGSVDENETASAAGLMNFVRTISGAFATSLVTTSWQDRSYTAHDQLAGIVDPAGTLAVHIAGAPALAGQAAREMFNMMVSGQSLLLATNGLMMAIAVVFFVAAFSIVLAPKAARAVDAASIGH